MKKMGPLVKVIAAATVGGFTMQVEFEDGTRREIDLEPFLRGPIFEPVLEDPVYFGQVRIVGGTIAWPNGADIDPDVLYYGLEPAWMEEREQL